MTFSPLQRLRIVYNRVHGMVHGDAWFPHIPLAAALGLGGVWLLQADLGVSWMPFLRGLLHGQVAITPGLLPPLLIGVGMLVMAFGLLLRSRIAWIMAMLLAATGAASMLFGTHVNGHLLLGYFVLMLALLLVAWRQFNHSSVAASTLFALTSVVMLLMYATFGTYYLGNEFDPHVTDLVTALYYAMVTMSTVGYGDITPQTAEAKLFSVSVIVLGVAVFATSLTAVIAPMVSRSLQRIVHHKGSGMKRENHFVVIGNSPLAINTSRELSNRGQAVTRVLRETPADLDEQIDVVTGDPGSVEVLRQAGADKATAVLAMADDDSENAFVILAARELGGHARTVAAVNDGHHLARIKLVQPDVVIAPQILGGELAAMLLCGEHVTSEYVMQRVFQQRDNDPPDQSNAAT
ncbi:MAG TPA: voltage-gated potassium channel protein [Oleiagrimonas sp.]|nr:voltage-gated potassium channel protein [Oleiagrimonas sp.]